MEPGAHGASAGGEPAHEHGAGQEPAFDLGDEAVGELELAAVDRPRRDQRGGVGPVGAAATLGVLGGAEREPAGLVAADETAEQGRVVEARDAPPVDRTVGRHERGRAGVADQAVVADRHRRAVTVGGADHQLLPRNSPSTAP